MKKTQIDSRTKIWPALNNRCIVLAGLENEQREFYQTNLMHISRQKNIKLTVTEQTGTIKPDDLILIFAQMKEQDFDASEGWKVLLETFDMLSRRKWQAAVVITDCAVYGKIFGRRTGSSASQMCEALSGGNRQYAIKETELGYISHTGKTETALQYMRMTEQLACRLAVEEQLPIRVVRQSLRQEKEDLEQMIEALLVVLLHGKDGEIYNLPASGVPFERRTSCEAACVHEGAGCPGDICLASTGAERRAAAADFECPLYHSRGNSSLQRCATPGNGQGEISPLSPIAFDADTQKIEALMAAEDRKCC